MLKPGWYKETTSRTFSTNSAGHLEVIDDETNERFGCIGISYAPRKSQEFLTIGMVAVFGGYDVIESEFGDLQYHVKLSRSDVTADDEDILERIVTYSPDRDRISAKTTAVISDGSSRAIGVDNWELNYIKPDCQPASG